MSAAYRAYKTNATSTKTVDQRSTFAYLGSMTLLHVTGAGGANGFDCRGKKKDKVRASVCPLGPACLSNRYPLSR